MDLLIFEALVLISGNFEFFIFGLHFDLLELKIEKGGLRYIFCRDAQKVENQDQCTKYTCQQLKYW